MVEEKLLGLIKQGPTSWNIWRRQNPSVTPDLSHAELPGYDLFGANFAGANLTRSNLDGANLSEANLVRANLSGTRLQGATITRANLAGANLSKGLTQLAIDLASFNNEAEADTVASAAMSGGQAAVSVGAAPQVSYRRGRGRRAQAAGGGVPAARGRGLGA